MQALQFRTQIEADGVLTVVLPAQYANRQLEVIIIVRPEDRDPNFDWEAFVNETYGSLADDPIERGEQVPISPRDEIE